MPIIVQYALWTLIITGALYLVWQMILAQVEIAKEQRTSAERAAEYRARSYAELSRLQGELCQIEEGQTLAPGGRGERRVGPGMPASHLPSVQSIGSSQRRHRSVTPPLLQPVYIGPVHGNPQCKTGRGATRALSASAAQRRVLVSGFSFAGSWQHKDFFRRSTTVDLPGVI